MRQDNPFYSAKFSEKRTSWPSFYRDYKPEIHWAIFSLGITITYLALKYPLAQEKIVTPLANFFATHSKALAPENASTPGSTILSQITPLKDVANVSSTISRYSLQQIAQLLNEFNQHLDPEVKNNINLFAPVINTILGLLITGSTGLVCSFITTNMLSPKLDYAHEIDYLTKQGQTYLHATPEPQYLEAAIAFQNARKLLTQYFSKRTHPDFENKLNTLYFNEILALFHLGKWETPKSHNALALLEDALAFTQEKPDLFTLKGIIQLELGELNAAAENFKISLELDGTQSDIDILYAYAIKNYSSTTSYDLCDTAKFTHRNSMWFITFYYHAKNIFEHAKKVNSFSLYKKSTAFALDALEELPKNPIFKKNAGLYAELVLEGLHALHDIKKRDSTFEIRLNTQIPCKSLSCSSERTEHNIELSDEELVRKMIAIYEQYSPFFPEDSQTTWDDKLSELANEFRLPMESKNTFILC